MNHPLGFGLLGFLGVLLLSLGLARGLLYAYHPGAVDFRNRVVAARQADLGLNPYTFKWTPEHSGLLLDPSEDRDAKYSRMTSPPTTLWLHSWFADWKYSTQKAVNFILIWASFFFVPIWIAWALSCEMAVPGMNLFGTVTFLSGFFASSAIWLFHLERGQQYSYFAAFLTLAAFPPKFGRNPVRRGATAVAIFFRQTLGPSIALSFRERKPIRDLLIIAAIGVVLLIPVLAKYPLEYWKDYFACTHDWYLRRYGIHERVAPLVSSFPVPEGDSSIPLFLNFGVPGNIVYEKLWDIVGFIPYSVGMLATLVVSALTLFRLWRAREESAVSFAFRFFSGLYLIDLALPAPRSGYNAVIFFPALLLVFFVGNRWARTAALLSIVLSVAAIPKVFYSPHGIELGFIFCAVFALAKKVRS